MTGKLCSNQVNTRIKNWRAYGEGCYAANNGQPIGDNPHDPVGNPVAYGDWNDGYNGANPSCCEVSGGGGNLWTDNPDSVGSGWTDNGNGTYTASGADGTSVEQSVSAGSIVDGETYTVSFDMSGYTSGSVAVYLGGSSQFGVTADVSANGSFSEDVTVSLGGGAANLISIDASSSFTGTVGNISVVLKT